MKKKFQIHQELNDQVVKKMSNVSWKVLSKVQRLPIIKKIFDGKVREFH